MIPNIHQSVDEIIAASDPAQKILWQQIKLIAGENAAVQQLYYQGSFIVGTEFGVSVAGRIYFAYELEFSQETSNGFNTQGFVTLNSFAPFNTMYYSNNAVYWNATAAAIYFQPNDIFLKNVIFRSLAMARYRNIKFNGYKIQG